MQTIYIKQGISCRCQTGSVAKPFLVEPNDAYFFDDIFRNHRGPTTFFLAPGTYITRGAWGFDEHDCATIDPNSRIVGLCGSEATRIVLAEDYCDQVNGQPAQYLEAIIGGGPNGIGSEQMLISGLTIDCSAARLPVIGLHTFSSGSRITDVRVIGINGVWGGYEGFGILVNDGPSSRGGGSVVTACRVEIARTVNSYVNGIYLGSLAVRGAPNSIEGCYVEAPIIDGAKRAHTAYAANENTEIRNCVGNGFERFAFSDTGNAGDIDIVGCRGDFGYCAVDYPCKSSEGNPVTYRRRLRVSGCTFTNDRPSSDHAILLLLQDQSPDHDLVDIHDIDVEGCRVTSALPAGKFYVCSLQAAKMKSVWIHNSTFPQGSVTGDGVYAPTPGSEVSIEVRA